MRMTLMMVFLGGMMLAFLGERAGLFAAKSWVYAVCFFGVGVVGIADLMFGYRRGFVETYGIAGAIQRKNHPWAFFFCFSVYMGLMLLLVVLSVFHLWSIATQ